MIEEDPGSNRVLSNASGEFSRQVEAQPDLASADISDVFARAIDVSITKRLNWVATSLELNDKAEVGLLLKLIEMKFDPKMHVVVFLQGRKYAETSCTASVLEEGCWYSFTRVPGENEQETAVVLLIMDGIPNESFVLHHSTDEEWIYRGTELKVSREP